MSSLRSRNFLVASLLALAGALSMVPRAHALNPLPHTYHVGVTGSGSSCDFASIQAAINAASATAGDTIVIDGGQSYSAQHLSINGKSLTLTAGPCQLPIGGTASPAANAQVTLSGSSGASSAVLTISGSSNVTLADLVITGNSSSNDGGGISYSGTGTLTLSSVEILANSAANGGGIAFAGSGGSATLVLGANTQIINNTATSGGHGSGGGGVKLAGSSTLTMTGDASLLFDNHAPNGDGGGLLVIGPALANIGSPGLNGTAAIDLNDANYGGGIAAESGSSDDDRPVVRMFTSDPTRPVGVSNNTAAKTGGGIYLKPYAQFLPFADAIAYLCAWDFRIANNIAQEGAAIYGDVDSATDHDAGSVIELGSCNEAGQSFPVELGAVACTNSALCNTIDGNEATDPTSGSAVLLQNDGLLLANRFAMRGNEVAHAIRIVGDETEANLSDCLIAQNTIAHELIYASGNSTPITIEACTFANDLIGAAHVIHTESDLSINDSIIDEAGTLALDYSGTPANLVAHYVVSNDVTTLPVATGVIHATPNFVDLANGDYHLQPNSIGIDLAPIPSPADPTQGVDLDGHPRNIDLPSVINAYGYRDIGAYERQNLFRECGASDSIFCDGFDH